jgi:hypothetical protein
LHPKRGWSADNPVVLSYFAPAFGIAVSRYLPESGTILCQHATGTEHNENQGNKKNTEYRNISNEIYHHQRLEQTTWTTLQRILSIYVMSLLSHQDAWPPG